MCIRDRSQCKIITLARRHARLLQKVRRVAAEGVARQILYGPNLEFFVLSARYSAFLAFFLVCNETLQSTNHANDFCTASVRAAETVEIAGAFCDFLLESGGVLHHGHCLVNVKVGFAVQGGQTEHRAFGGIDAAFTDKPPGSWKDC